ncbi:NAD-dependent epimerase/dehydratase family protein [Facklamia sp. DSM 111018]|uniref:NAD-dependent epimerase/dehydratase family protein n=1 Tax=Facklamia lactis TaxID=2749967 RepID=A0ABS0LMW0_9LACT|nr:NAD-dependent epimerase/dehydratase family protein [Facklamia lactis]MBG9979946.1 NAD-dependent epimerase/dehydratase family protein [Facklamia lactis]MBG9985374.1 NAD-dependent epimerase/dehydratase family protein [Facklamia lactis]
MKKILITGKNSYIGTSVEKWLKKSEENFLIDTVDTRDNKWKEIDFSQYQVVFHVAGIAHANAKKNQADLYYAVNRDLCIEIAQYAKEKGVRQFIFMSSAIVYTSSKLENGRITRSTIPQSKDPYGDSKIQAENGLSELEDSDFKVVILRPPMIYGKGSRGNYPKLAKMARKIPFFPNYPNKRSMLYIDHLAELIRLVILNEDNGIFFPQNKEYTQTSQMVEMIANFHGHPLVLIRVFNPLIKLFKDVTIINKVFGNLFYDKELSQYSKGNYQLYSLQETITLTEN